MLIIMLVLCLPTFVVNTSTMKLSGVSIFENRRENLKLNVVPVLFPESKATSGQTKNLHIRAFDWQIPLIYSSSAQFAISEKINNGNWHPQYKHKIQQLITVI